MAAQKEISPRKFASLLAKSPEETLARIEVTHDMAALMLVTQSPYHKYLPEEFKGQESSYVAIGHAGECLPFIPVPHRTHEMYLKTARAEHFPFPASSIEYLPEKVLNAELCMEAVSHDGLAYKYIPEDLWTPKLCLAAVSKKASAIEYIPRSMVTQELCECVAKKTPRSVNSLVPEEFRTPELYALAEEVQSPSIALLPVEERTPEVCMAAVKRKSGELRYVPQEQKTPELCAIALEHDGANLEFVPEELVTLEMSLEVVRKWGYYLKYVPQKFQTYEVWLAAVAQQATALKFIPAKECTDEMLCAAEWAVEPQYELLADRNPSMKAVCRYLIHMHCRVSDFKERKVQAKDNEWADAKYWFLMALCGYESKRLPNDISVSEFLREEERKKKKSTV